LLIIISRIRTWQERHQEDAVTAPPAPAPAPATRAPRRQQGGPPPLAVGLAYGVLLVTGVILSVRTPLPSAGPAAVLAYDRSHHTLMQVAAFFEFAAAAPLAIWTATVYRRLRTLGVTAPGAVIALSGGLLAAASLALSGLITWTIAQASSVADPALARVLGDLAFATGSAGFVVPVGLLVAGVSVPALLLGLAPRPWAWFGLVVAAISELSSLVLLTSALDFTLPIGRFGSLIWLVGISVLLPQSRHEVRGRPEN
jgi:hypothetical protein